MCPCMFQLSGNLQGLLAIKDAIKEHTANSGVWALINKDSKASGLVCVS